MIRRILIATTLVALLGCSVQTPVEERYDLILKGGTVVDGLGNAPFRADVGLKGDKIVSISRDGLKPNDANDVLDVSGRVISPGFIDNHAHIQTTIHQHPLAENFIR